MHEIRIAKTQGRFVLNCASTSQAGVLGILGPSGSGKTTLLNCIAGAIVPDQGRITIHDQVIFDDEVGTNLSVAQRRLGYVFQSDLLFPHLSVRKNLTYGWRADRSGPTTEEVVRALELGELLNRRADSLSGGEARRVAIGRALLSSPRLLLLDEPLTGLDRRLARRCLAWLSYVVKTFQIPTLYVSHTISDVMFLCDEVWVLSNGRVAAQGSPRRILSQPAFSPVIAESELENIFVARRAPATSGAGAAFLVGDQTLSVGNDAGDCTDAVLVIRSGDIILARERPRRISARNVLTGRVSEIQELERRVIISVDLGVPWMVTLTAAAVAELELEVGCEVFVVVKASSIEVTALPIPPASTDRQA